MIRIIKHLQKLPIVLAVLYSSFLGCSCNLISPDGTPKLLWSTSLSSGELIEGGFQSVFHKPTNSVLFLGSLQNKPILYMINTQDGKKTWEWQDWFSSSEYVSSNYPYIEANNFVMNTSSKLYAINLITGKSTWRQQTPLVADVSATGIADNYFVVINRTTVSQIDIKTGYGKILFTIPDTVTGGRTFLSSPVPVIEQATGDTLLVSAWSYGYNQNSFGAAYLLLYNLTQKRIVYNSLQREGIASGQTGSISSDHPPIVKGSNVFLTIGKSMQCTDLVTNRLIWRNTDFAGSFLLSPPIYANNKIYCCPLDNNLYCIDPSNGKILWKTSTEGSSVGLLYLNDVIYLTSFGNGKLYAIDANTGAYIWQLTSPDYESSNKQSFFKDNVTTDGKNIFVSTYLNLYCYKAAR